MPSVPAGEFALIASLKALLAERRPVRIPAGAHGLLVGIGDDCAVWRCGDTVQLATTDTMVDGVHFRRPTTGWRDLGWKALAVNLSDIAAMGGAPDYALVTLGLPPDVDQADILDLYHGLQDCATAFSTELAGGDIVRSRQLFISVALIGRAGSSAPFPNSVLLRSTAQPGDAIAVTGWLGSSAGGLHLLDGAGTVTTDTAVLAAAHRRPEPRLGSGRLALDAGVRCGMDISDGLAGDLEKLCLASGAAAEVELAALPVAPALRSAFPDRWEDLALSGGEDYELLLCAPAEVLTAVAERSEVPVTIIGTVTAGPPGRVVIRDREGVPRPVERAGWDHLAP